MTNRNSKNVLKGRIPALLIVVSLLLSLVLMTAGTTFAASTPELTGFTITSPKSGNITQGMAVTMQVDVFDPRVTVDALTIDGVVLSTNVTAKGVVNCKSFTGGSVTATNITPTDAGVSYTLIFKVTYTGVGNTFTCDISYTDKASEKALPIAISSLTSNTIPRCVPTPPPPAPAPPGEPAPPAPDIPTNFILRDANYGSETVYAGEPFTLSVVILASSGTSSVNNVSVSFAPPEQMTFADGSSVIYIGRMGPGSTSTVSANLLPNGNIPEGSYTINISVEGFDSAGLRVSAPMTVTVPVLQPERFEIFNAMLPTFLTAGMDDGSGFGSVTLVNKGQGAVANVTVDIVGDGLFLSEGRQFIGNIAGGAERTADFMISASTPGRIPALVIVTYENARGDQKSLEHAFDIDVVDFVQPDFEDPEILFPEEMPGSAGLPVWGLLLIIVAAAVAGTIILLRIRKKKKAEAEAALDDFDDEDDD